MRQRKGIPMGDALSPAMTIGTCGWMEKEWLRTLSPLERAHFLAKRYMDDILIFYEKDTQWDHEDFMRRFKKSECYLPPLKLEAGGEDIFLETQFHVDNGYIGFRLKNVNAVGEKRVWRYHHFASYAPYTQKRSTMVAALKKVDMIASDSWERYAYMAFACILV